MPHQATLRERNRDRTREEIAAAAMALFAERGYPATTVDHVAAAAGVAPRTFFRYFPTKEDVVFADHARNVARLRAALAEGAPDEPLLRRIRRAILDAQFGGGQDPALQLVRARLVEEVPAVRARLFQLAEELEAVVADAVAADIGADADTAARTSIIVGAVFGALRGARRAAGRSPASDPRRLVEAAFDVIEYGADRHLPHNLRSPSSLERVIEGA